MLSQSDKQDFMYILSGRMSDPISLVNDQTIDMFQQKALQITKEIWLKNAYGSLFPKGRKIKGLFGKRFILYQFSDKTLRMYQFKALQMTN